MIPFKLGPIQQHEILKILKILKLQLRFGALQRIRKTLSVCHFVKKSSASIRQTPQPPMVWDCNRDEGRYWSCTLMHASIICRYGRPGPLHKCVEELSPWMCAALLKMQTRATTSSARSKHWFQLHTLVHALILCICSCNRPLHVFAKLRRLRTCAVLQE